MATLQSLPLQVSVGSPECVLGKGEGRTEVCGSGPHHFTTLTFSTPAPHTLPLMTPHPALP